MAASAPENQLGEAFAASASALEGAAPHAPQPPAMLASHLLYLSACNCSYAGAKTFQDKLGLTLVKLLRVKTPIAGDFACVTALTPFSVENSSLTVAERDAVAPIVIKLAHLGFELPALMHLVRDPTTATTAVFASMVHESGSSFARITSKTRVGLRAISPFVQFYSRTDQGVLLTWGRGCELRQPANWDILTNHMASLKKLWDLHRNRIASHRLVTMAQGDLAQICESIQSDLMATQLRSGVLRPLTRAEQARAAAALGESQLAAPSGEHAEVLFEIARLQSGESGGWKSSIILLAVSLLAFVAVGFGQSHWTLKTIGLLVAVLLFHEAGHYLAMRLSGYRNVKMFFIPFLGAAVSGQGFRVPTWTKVLVSLAGPLPGIAVGVLLSIVGLLLSSHGLGSLALLLLVLNGMNLLPILPLDGGRVVGLLLLPRSPFFAVIFRAIAVACLVLAGLGLHQTVLIVLGAFLAMGIPLAYRLSKLALELRREGLAERYRDDHLPLISDAVAEPIIARIKQMNPHGLNVRLTAKQTLDVAESLMIEPASWPATVALLAVQGAAMVVAMVFSALAVISLHGGLSTLHGRFRREMERAQAQREHRDLHMISPDAITRILPLPGLAFPTVVLCATTGDHAQALTLGDAMRRRLPADGACLVFGDSVLVGLMRDAPGERAQLMPTLSAADPQAFVSSADDPVQLQLYAPATRELAAVSDGLEGMLTCPQPEALIAPWDPTDARSDAQKTRSLDTIRICSRLLQAAQGVDLDGATAQLDHDLASARIDGNGPQVARLRTQRRQLVEQSYLACVSRELALHPDRSALLAACKILSPRLEDTGFPALLTTAARPDIGVHAQGTPNSYAISGGGYCSWSGRWTSLAPSLHDSDPDGTSLQRSASNRDALDLIITPVDVMRCAPAVVHWFAEHQVSGLRYGLRLEPDNDDRP